MTENNGSQALAEKCQIGTKAAGWKNSLITAFVSIYYFGFLMRR